MSESFIIKSDEPAYRQLADKLFNIIDLLGLMGNTSIVPGNIIDIVDRLGMRIIFKTTVFINGEYGYGYGYEYRTRELKKTLESVTLEDMLKSDRKCEQLIFESADDWLLFKLALE